MPSSVDSRRPIMAPSVCPFSVLFSSLNVMRSVSAEAARGEKENTAIDTESCQIYANILFQVASKRNSKRFSTFSGVPSLAASDTTTQTTTSTGDPRIQEIKEWTQGFERLEQKRLQQQRYAPTSEKTDNLSKLALGAKVERALGRRMTDQDATYRPKLISEKAGMGRSVTTAS